MSYGLREARAPQLPGHDIGAVLGFGSNGAVWSATSESGRDVVVAVLNAPAHGTGREQLGRLARLRRLHHPNVVALSTVRRLPDGRWAVVSEHVAGPSLATVREARGGLELAEVALLLHDLGHGLGFLHGHGIVHGDVSPANVVVRADGRPVLIDLAVRGAGELGTAGFVAPERRAGAAPGAPGDVWSLASLARWAQAGAPVGTTHGPGEPHEVRALEAILAGALDPDPARRTEARALAAAAAGLGARRPVRRPPAPALAQARLRGAEAVTLRRPPPGGAATRLPQQPQRRSRLRRSGARAGVVLVTAAATWVALGAMVPREPPGRAGAPPGPEMSTALARDALTGVLAERDAVLAAADATGLARVVVAGSPAARADDALIDQLAASGSEIEGLRTTVADIDAVELTDSRLRVEAWTGQQTYERVHRAGRERVAAQAPDCREYTLERVDDGWRLREVSPCA